MKVGVENKLYSREKSKELLYRGRIRVQLKSDDGKPLNPDFPSRKLNCMTGNTYKHKFTACSSKICHITHFTERWQSIISVVVSPADKLVFRKHDSNVRLEVTILVLEGSAGELSTAELDTGSFSESFKHNPYYTLTFLRCSQLWSSKLSVSKRFTLQYDVYASLFHMSFGQPTVTLNLLYKLEDQVVYSTKITSSFSGGLGILSYAFVSE